MFCIFLNINVTLNDKKKMLSDKLTFINVHKLNSSLLFRVYFLFDTFKNMNIELWELCYNK